MMFWDIKNDEIERVRKFFNIDKIFNEIIIINLFIYLVFILNSSFIYFLLSYLFKSTINIKNFLFKPKKKQTILLKKGIIP